MYAQAEVSLYDRLKERHAARIYSDYFSALCPYHDDTSPSLLVYANGFVCMACNERGSLDKLARKWGEEPAPVRKSRSPRLPFSQAELEDVYLEAHLQLMRRKIGLDYLHRRGLTDEVIERNLIGFYRGFYTIPVFEGMKREELVRTGIVVRVHPKFEDKFGTRYAIYGKSKYYLPPNRADNTDYPNLIVITFGIFDAIVMNMAGVYTISTVHGKGRLDPSFLNDISPFYMIAVVPDKGEEAEARHLATRLGLRAFVVNLHYDSDTKDPNDLWSRGVLVEQLRQKLASYHRDHIAQSILNLVTGGTSHDHNP